MYLIIKLTKRKYLHESISPDDFVDDFSIITENCFINTGKFFQDKKEACKHAETLENNSEKYGVIEITVA